MIVACVKLPAAFQAVALAFAAPAIHPFTSNLSLPMRSRDYRRCVFVALMSALAPSLACAEQWPQWRGPDRSNRSTETGLFGTWRADGPPLAWTASGMGAGYASVAVSGSTVFTTGNQAERQAVVAVDAKTGQVKWTTPISPTNPEHGYGGSRSTPTIDGERLYVVSSDGAIVCLQVADGGLLWRREFSQWNGKMMSGWGFSESPLVDGDFLICTPGGPEAMLVALNKTSGEQVWATPLPPAEAANDASGKPLKDGAGYASPIISNGGGVKQYVQFVGRGLIGVRASDGKLLWQYTRVANGTANIPTPIIDGDYIFTSSGYNTGSALLKLSADRSRGVNVEEVYWLDGRELQNKHGGMVLVAGHIYCGHGNGNGLPICVEMATGKIAWGPERAAGSGETSTIYADGHIIFRRDDGTVILAEATPEEFRPVHTFMPAHQEDKSWAHPVIADGVLYLREQDKLMAYRLR